jgi:hypothetical protein
LLIVDLCNTVAIVMATVIPADFADRSRSNQTRASFSDAANAVAVAAQPEQWAEGTSSATPSLPAAILKRSVALLETFHIGSVIWEYIHRNGIQTEEQLSDSFQKLDQFIRTVIADVDEVIVDIQTTLGEMERKGDGLASYHWSQVVKNFSAIVTECPIFEMLILAKIADQPSLGHRATVAFDALQSFVWRHDSGRAETLRIVGEQYQLGHLRLKEVAQLMGMPPSNAVFELERGGYGRTIETMTISSDERNKIYSNLRLGRHRTLSPVDLDLVKRDTIASERIEGVDAREWIALDAR